MATVKTAISVRKDVFDQMDRLARRMRVPRSRLFTRAAEEFIARHGAADLTRQINRALATAGELPEDKWARAAFLTSFSRLIEGTWRLRKAMCFGPTCDRR